MNNDNISAISQSIESQNKLPAPTQLQPYEILLQGIGKLAEERKASGNGINIEAEIEGNQQRQTRRITALNKYIQQAADAVGCEFSYVADSARLYNGRYWAQVTPGGSDQNLNKVITEAVACFGINDDYVDGAFYEKTVSTFKQKYCHPINNVKEGATDTILNCNNKTVIIKADGSIEARAHRSDDLLTYVLPYDYDPTATAPTFTKFLERVLPDPRDRCSLQEYCGAILDKGRKYEKMLYLYGPTASNGKSTFLGILGDTLGGSNCSNSSLESILDKSGTGQVTRWGLMGKLANICEECERTIEGMLNEFKNLISGSKFEVRRPYGRDTETVPAGSYARLVFASNYLPRFKGEVIGNGEARRILFVPFDVKIQGDEVDPMLGDKLRRECSGVLNWMLEGRRMLEANGHRFTENPNSDRLAKLFLLKGNSVREYLDDCGIKPFDFDESVKYKETIVRIKPAHLYAGGDELYEHGIISYLDWCKTSGHDRAHLGRSDFYTQLNLAGINPHGARTNTGGYFAEILIIPESKRE